MAVGVGRGVMWQEGEVWVEKGGEFGQVLGRTGMETMDEGGDVLSAGPIHVEEESRMGGVRRQRSERGTFDGPFCRVGSRRVLRGEKLCEEWFGSVFREPPRLRECDVDLFEPAV